ncbi:dihydrofolate reductase family protein [Kribbella sp. CA-293567]|uniref:dihydrofolate reductase family protein n=1 Tax=Kribbella sp. CA-293567 TaxID=3002436 RepID=UPI0022DE7027|nr:dihydrofolate reductase family protein [Kribbella sp. CA-293567]WBQ07933.1 dihydrofolate reductase family protein [Kribbella sp. CA-293567]
MAITAFQSVTLDGVMQGLGRPDEDTRGDFTHGGWGNGYQDEVSMQFASDGMAEGGALLFGRRTYDDLLGFWTTTPDPNPFTDVLVNTRKYVASRSKDTVLDHPNSVLLAGEAAETVMAVEQDTAEDLTIMGSGEVARALHKAGLIDRYVLQIHPIVLGSGTRLFGADDRTDLVLERSVTTTTGVVIAQYRATRSRRC